MKVLSFGEIVWDIYSDKACLGGAPLNFAAHTAIQGDKSFLISAVGDDALGNDAVKIAESIGVDTKYISLLKENETSKCFVVCDENALPSYNLQENAVFDKIEFPQVDEQIDVICFGTLALRYENNRKILTRILKEIPHKEVFTDINLRSPFYTRDSIEFCLGNATILKINDEEMNILSNMFFDIILKKEDIILKLSEDYQNLKLIIVTEGAKGAFCYNRAENKFYYGNAKSAKLVSTVGAGDSFSAAFLSRYMSGVSLEKCLDYAAEISSIVCSSADAFSENIKEKVNLIDKV